jgi:hypothetical protein
VTIYLVDEHIVTHTCPGDLAPHAVDTRHTIVHITPGRACLRPVTVTCGNRRAQVPCGQREPADRQCPNCRNIITIRTGTAEHLGWQGPTDHPTTSTGTMR